MCFFIGNQIRIERKKSYSFYIAEQLKSIRYIFTALMVTCLMRKLDSTLCYAFFHSSSRVHLVIEAAIFFFFLLIAFIQRNTKISLISMRRKWFIAQREAPKLDSQGNRKIKALSSSRFTFQRDGY